MLERNIQDQDAGTMPSANGDEIDAKLVGAYAAYARGLTPRHAGGRLTWQRLGGVDKATVMKGDPLDARPIDVTRRASIVNR